MRQLVFVDGPNFSGRSRHLHQWLMQERQGGSVVYFGPSAASALTGLASSVAAEIGLYTAWNTLPPPPPWRDYFEPKSSQPLTSLSGGEQILLALAESGRVSVRAVAVDGALEQLDDEWRKWALAHLRLTPGPGEVQFADNRALSEGVRYDRTVRMPSGPGQLQVRIPPEAAGWPGDIDCAPLHIEDLSFRYRHGRAVFSRCSFDLKPGSVYRLTGATGAGKSTLIRLLCGVLPAQSGGMYLNERPYRPYYEGNRLIALSMQNPDDQWTDVTVAGDLKRRLRRMIRSRLAKPPSADALLSRWEVMLDVRGHFQRHVLDSPRTLRKRFSWIWPLSGYLPWLVFDEPTLGQDDETVAQFASAIVACAARGHGVIYVSHDQRLPRLVPGLELHVADGQVSA